MRSVTRPDHTRSMRPNPMRVRGVLLTAFLATALWWAVQPHGIGANGLGGPVDSLGDRGGPLTTPIPAASSEGLVVPYTVRSGDTLWSIARSVQPEGDVRPLVDRILVMRGDRPLQVGEGLMIPIELGE